MQLVSITLTLEYDRDLVGDPHWGTFATIFAAQAKMRLVKAEVLVDPPAEVETKVSQEPAPGTGAPFVKGDTYT